VVKLRSSRLLGPSVWSRISEHDDDSWAGGIAAGGDQLVTRPHRQLTIVLIRLAQQLQQRQAAARQR